MPDIPEVSTLQVNPIALLGVGVAAPSVRLKASDVSAAWGNSGGRGQVARCDPDEDTLTLAWAASIDALAAAGIGASDIGGLWWGTSRPPFADGPSHSFLATTLGIAPSAQGSLISGSGHSGVDALNAAWDALVAGHSGAFALVVASDSVLPGLGTAGESTAGAGATAWVLAGGNVVSAGNGSGAPARLVSRVTTALPVIDRYRGDGDSCWEEIYDGRLFREAVYVPLMTKVGRALAEAGESAPGQWSLGDPDGKLAAAVAKKLGAPLASAPVAAELGDTGAASALLGVVPALDAAGTVGLIGYGGGRATAVAINVTRPVPGSEDVLARLGGGRSVTYTEVLRAQNQLQPMATPVPMGVPPGSAAFVRGNVEMLSLEGARCADCSTVSTPPSIHPTCVSCGGSNLTIEHLPRFGTVQTFVVNQTMPPPFQAPLPIIVIDLEGGARIMVQGSPTDAHDLAVDDAIELRLRRYAVERSVPVYGYKAFRLVQGSAETTSAAAQTPVTQGAQ